MTRQSYCQEHLESFHKRASIRKRQTWTTFKISGRATRPSQPDPSRPEHLRIPCPHPISARIGPEILLFRSESGSHRSISGLNQVKAGGVRMGWPCSSLESLRLLASLPITYLRLETTLFPTNFPKHLLRLF